MTKKELELKVSSLTTKETGDDTKDVETMAATLVNVPDGIKSITLTVNAENRKSFKDIFGVDKPKDIFTLTIGKTNRQASLDD